MEQKNKSQEQQGKVRKVATTLDTLPAGDPHSIGKVDTKVALPEGVTSKMLYNDIIRIGWPAFVELTLMQLTSMFDTMQVSRLGAWATSAVGLTNLPKMLLGTAFMALNTGTMAMVGRYRGAGQQENAKRVIRQTFILNLLCGVFFGIIGLLFAEPAKKRS